MDLAIAVRETEPEIHFIEDLCYVAKLTRCHVEIALREIGLCPGQDQFLDALRIDATKRLGEVADELNIRASTASKITNRLVDRGFAKRVSMPGDLRKIGLALTSEGSKAQRAVRDIWQTLETEMFSELSLAETDEIREGLCLMDRRLKERLRRLR